jgi:hypothetical protein
VAEGRPAEGALQTLKQHARATGYRRSLRPVQGRGATSPNTEDGGGRSAHRRHRPRLQRYARRHHGRP